MKHSFPSARRTGMGLAMRIPRVPPGRSAGSGGADPVANRSFDAALIGCGIVVMVGWLMVRFGGKDVAAVGASLLAVGLLGLFAGAVVLLIERRVRRRRGAEPLPNWLFRPGRPSLNGSRPDHEFRDRRSH